MVWGVVRQDLKAEWEEAAAVVASLTEAEQALCTGLGEVVLVTGKVVDVWMGLLSIQRGTVEGSLESDMVVLRAVRDKCFFWLLFCYYRYSFG